MIPVRLTVRNFMSYGEEPASLDFTGLHVATLSGDNGNGKSALLDAMTYALWGKTRASSAQASGDDDLVRLGAEDMEVQLEFKVGDDTYRATRKRNRRTHSADWQLHVLDTNGDWRPGGGSSMAETGRQIHRLLRMEYETFLNSAYIQQGRADEFTRQKPNDRKRILGDILDLSRYDRLEEMARERRGDCDLALKDIEGEIRHLESRAAEGETASRRLAEAEVAAAEAAAARDNASRAHEEARAGLAALEVKAGRADEMDRQVKDEEARLVEAAGRLDEARRVVSSLASLLADRDLVIADYQRLSLARSVIDETREAIEKAHSTRQERASLQAAIDLARQELLREMDRAAADVLRAEERTRQIESIDRRLADMGPKLSHFEKALAELDPARAALRDLQERFTERAGASRKLKGEIAETEEVISLLGEPKPACPVCSSDLTGGRQQAVLVKQQRRLATLHESLVEVNREGASLKRERDVLQQRVETLEEQARSEAALRAQRAELAATRERIVAESGENDAGKEVLESLRRRLSAGDFALAERARLAEAEQELALLAADVDRSNEAATIVRDLAARGVERRAEELQRAEQERCVAAAAAERLEAELSHRSTRRDELVRLLNDARAELVGLNAARGAFHEKSTAFQTASAAVEYALSQAARYRQTVEDCEKAAEQVKGKAAERDRIAKDKQAYTDLAAAFGKKGVQAHIIDNALPEVQEEANRLLARLTDNAMQVTLSTLRQARAGSNQIETLDISITDEAGTRPYEMYSGGEAFRVNFALRIALSRLLARRAGSSLQTLILDEGFGTQDARGRERLVEAIETVKDEFSLILVISHIEDLKDAFPSRIEVTKTAAGSQITFVQ